MAKRRTNQERQAKKPKLGWLTGANDYPRDDDHEVEMAGGIASMMRLPLKNNTDGNFNFCFYLIFIYKFSDKKCN